MQQREMMVEEEKVLKTEEIMQFNSFAFLSFILLTRSSFCFQAVINDFIEGGYFFILDGRTFLFQFVSEEERS